MTAEGIDSCVLSTVCWECPWLLEIVVELTERMWQLVYHSSSRASLVHQAGLPRYASVERAIVPGRAVPLGRQAFSGVQNRFILTRRNIVAMLVAHVMVDDLTGRTWMTMISSPVAEQARSIDICSTWNIARIAFPQVASNEVACTKVNFC